MAKLCFSGGFFCCFFYSSLLRASRSGKIKVVARTDVFSAGGLTRRKYLALKVLFYKSACLTRFLLFECTRSVAPCLRSDATGQGATEL